MEQIPRRYSLVAQVGDILRSEIESGELRDALPSELELSRRFRVSRPTIRDSLEILRQAGLIESARGQNHRILPQKLKGGAGKSEGGISVLGFEPLDQLSPFSLALISQIQLTIGTKFDVQIVSNPNLVSPVTLRELTARKPQRCWVLIGPPPEVLSWFEASKLPCLAMAPSIQSASIPILAMDMHSIILHAFGMAGQRGYSGPILLLPASRQSSEITRSFTAIQGKYPNAESAIFTHDATMSGVRRTIEKIARARISQGVPPMVLAVRPKHALMALAALRTMEFRPGEHFGLVSIGRENYLDYIVPTMACYMIKRQRLFKKFLRMLSEILDSGYTRPGLFPVIADFCDGDTFPKISGK